MRHKQRDRSTLAASAVASAVAAAALGVCLATLSPVELFSDEAAPAGRVVELNWSPPLKQQVAAASSPVTLSPADKASAAVLSDTSFAPYRGTDDVLGSFYGGPFEETCPDLFADAAPASGKLRRTQAGRTSLSVTTWTYPAGMAPAAVERIRTRIADCTPNRDPYPVLSATSTPGPGFVAVAGNSGDGLAWALWSRGDLVVGITATAAASTPPTGTLAEAAQHFDDVAVAALRRAGCVQIEATADDAGRNPYSPAGYTGFRTETTIGLPGGPTRAVPETLPDDYVAVEYPRPDTAEVPAAGDLLPTAPSLSEEAGQVSLRVPVVPDAWPSDTAFPAFDQLPVKVITGLVDPDTYTLPSDAVTELPQAPAMPGNGPLSRTLRLVQLDKQGPGCGWAFTGMAAPDVDAEQIAAERAERSLAAYAALGSAQLAQQNTLDQWVAAYRSWLAIRADHDAYLEWYAEFSEVAAAWDEAHDAYTTALGDYERLRQVWLSAQVTPETPAPFDPVPTPTTAPQPQPPTSAPTPVPSATPVPSPTEEPQDPSTPVETPTGEPTATPTQEPTP